MTLEKERLIKPSQRQAIEALKEDLSYLESKEFSSLSERAQAYVLFAVLIEIWWQEYTQENQGEIWTPQPIRAARFLLKEEIIGSYENSSIKHIKSWLETRVSQDERLQTLFNASKERGKSLKTDFDFKISDEDLFKKRFSEGLGTGIVNSFKFAKLVWEALEKEMKPEIPDEETFINTIKRSNKVLTSLASKHLAVFSMIEQWTEMGSLGVQSGPFGGERELEGFDPKYFSIKKDANGFILNTNTAPSEPTFNQIEKIMKDKDRTGKLSSKAIGCPALHLALIQPFSEAAARHLYKCLDL